MRKGLDAYYLRSICVQIQNEMTSCTSLVHLSLSDWEGMFLQPCVLCLALLEIVVLKNHEAIRTV